jgi:hypothetical protein
MLAWGDAQTAVLVEKYFLWTLVIGQKQDFINQSSSKSTIPFSGLQHMK